ncbi:hypothetical protein MO867_22310 [Microbulbifer sp. OS29]|uniref:Uncharacterized protein n=1 Tax=Microbulbifer okhotskensis TaxID=2926617 RepID=A0A9X2ESL5_9GAMM|nr:hypothetical protein [Microbulbifer okhotskensis]MCO1337061.1 hypothetical protein [Microbulbifer okhotskensis]
MKILIVELFLLLTSFASAEELVVIGNLEFLKDTEITSSEICYEDDEESCHPWATFYLYKMEVVASVDERVTRKQFNVIYGRHALMKNDIHSVKVSLKELPVGNKFGASYQVIEIHEAPEL